MQIPQRKPKFKVLRPTEAIVLACLSAALGAAGLQAATQVTSFDPAAATVGNARLLLAAEMQYAQNYDERLPPAQTTQAFQAALRPYVPDPSVFVSRVTGKSFIPNAALSGQPLTALAHPDTVAVFQDAPPPSRTLDTVGYLDGHVERGGVVQGDPRLLSLGNAQALAIGVTEYTQDNDAVLPPTTTQAAFQTALLPYVHSARFFVDPISGKPFLPNPAVSQILLNSIADPSQTIVFQSQKPYQNGTPVVGYADGHITPALPASPGQRDLSQLKQIGLAANQYTQDYDGTLPLTTDYSTFEAELLPYTKNGQIFVSPGTGLAYLLNPAVSGASLSSIGNPDTVELARDAQLNADGTLNHLEVDGSVRQDAYFLPLSVAVGPDSLTHLLWPSAAHQASLWTLMPSGTLKTAVEERGAAFSFSVGADSQTRVLWHSGGGGGGVLTTPITGSILLDTLDRNNVLQTSQAFGPYDGWAALLLTTGPDSSSRLLWQRCNGALALWTLSAQGDYLESVPLPVLAGGTPIGLTLGAGGATRLLWRTAQGRALLATLSQNGRITRLSVIPVPTGCTPTALGLGADGISRVLCSGSMGSAAVVTVGANGAVLCTVRFTLPGGGTASQVAVGPSDLRVLWNAADGSGQLQTLTASGQQISVVSLTPYL